MALEKDNPYRKGLVALLQSIEEQIPLTEGSYLTIRYHLETEEAIIKFNEWVKSNLKEGKLKATEAEIVRAAVKARNETNDFGKPFRFFAWHYAQ